MRINRSIEPTTHTAAGWLPLILGILAMLGSSTESFSQSSTPFPQVTTSNPPACAASANLTGHMICTISNGRALAAVSVGVGASPGASVLDPASNTLGTLSSMATIGPSSCASTADGTGDVVCGWLASATKPNSGTGVLLAIRFNVFNNTKTAVEVPLMGGNNVATNFAPSCVTGNSVRGKVPVHQEPTDATICTFVENDVLSAIALDPATGYMSSVQNVGPATTNAGCTNANDGSNFIVCAAIDATSSTVAVLRGYYFDPRQPAAGVKTQVLFSGNSFDGVLGETADGGPGCQSPMDNQGEIICAIRNFKNELVGFAFDPNTGAVVGPQILGTTTMIGTPSCASPQIADPANTAENEVICAINSSSDILMGVKFNPRTGTSSGLISSGVTSNQDVSCTWQNIDLGQISCGVTLPGSNEFAAVVLTQ
jgi:hypothetical protein